MQPRALISTALLFGLVCCGGAESPPPRNVVLVSLDALGAGHVGSYGYERDTTPVLDRLASEGVLFEHAYTQEVWTLTSHLTMLTGLYPKAHAAGPRRAARPDVETLTEILREAGFRTGAFTGAGGLMKPDFGLGRGFQVYRTGRSHRLDQKERIQWLERQAVRQRADPSHRFFLFAHYYDIHSTVDTPLPYSAPEPFGLHFLPDGLDWERRGDTSLLHALAGRATERDRYVLTALYDGSVRRTDLMGLGVLIAHLRRLELYDDTLVVVTSDHGEEIFEHGMPLHMQPYEETARVPWVMRGPRIPAGLRIDTLVELVDLAPTILGLLDLPIPSAMQGRDLGPLLRGGRVEERPAFTEGLATVVRKTAVTAAVHGSRWSYVNVVVREDSGEFATRTPGELYRLDDDPGQERDLSAEHPALVARLERELLEWYAMNERVASGSEAAEETLLSDEERAHLEALGYVE